MGWIEGAGEAERRVPTATGTVEGCTVPRKKILEKISAKYFAGDDGVFTFRECLLSTSVHFAKSHSPVAVRPVAPALYLRLAPQPVPAT